MRSLIQQYLPEELPHLVADNYYKPSHRHLAKKRGVVRQFHSEHNWQNLVHIQQPTETSK
jgi:hypothetical protein